MDEGIKQRILILDDEASFRGWLKIELEEAGYAVIERGETEEAFKILSSVEIPLVLLDLGLGEVDGLSVLDEIKKRLPDVSVIMVTGNDDVDKAILCLKRGAEDYFVKKKQLDELLEKIKAVFKKHTLYRENQKLRSQIKIFEDREVQNLTSIVGQSRAIRKVIETVRRVASENISVVLFGETGTGKELFANLVHKLDEKRRHGPFETINCGAIPEHLLESELFGHRKGAFTGAFRDKPGRFLVANGGVIFLDEINSLSLSHQAKLLRALQDKMITPVGDTVAQKIDVRVISASNAVLEDEIKAGRFREDLYYRLNEICITIPSLRDRREDIPLLVEHFSEKHSSARPLQFTEEAIEYLCSLEWEGNVRELESFIKRLIAISKEDVIRRGTVGEAIRHGMSRMSINGDSYQDFRSKIELIGYQTFRKEQEQEMLRFFVEKADGNYSEAAKLMRLCFPTFYSMLRKYKMAGRQKRTKDSHIKH